MKRVARYLLPVLLLLPGCDGGGPVGRVSADRTTVEIGPSSVQRLRLGFEILETIDPRPLVFVHLTDAGGKLQRTFDHRVPVDWRDGQLIEYNLDLYQSSLADALPAGTYQLKLGVSAGPGERFRLQGPAGKGEVIDLASVQVVDQGHAPALVFSSDWDPPVAGADLQVLSRRAIPPMGAIGLPVVRSAGRVWLQLRVDGVGSEVQVRAACNGFDQRLVDPGTHRVEVPVDGPCELLLQASGAAWLEVLGWLELAG